MSLPVLHVSLPCRCLSLTFLCLVAAFLPVLDLFTAMSLPVLDVSLPSHCLCLTSLPTVSHGLFTFLPPPFFDLPLPHHRLSVTFRCPFTAFSPLPSVALLTAASPLSSGHGRAAAGRATCRAAGTHMSPFRCPSAALQQSVHCLSSVLSPPLRCRPTLVCRADLKDGRAAALQVSHCLSRLRCHRLVFAKEDCTFPCGTAFRLRCQRRRERLESLPKALFVAIFAHFTTFAVVLHCHCLVFAERTVPFPCCGRRSNCHAPVHATLFGGKMAAVPLGLLGRCVFKRGPRPKFSAPAS